MLVLKVYIDVYGHVGFVDKFPNDEKHAGLNDMLDEFVNQGAYGDSYPDYKPGFYVAVLEILNETYHYSGTISPEIDAYLQIKEFVEIPPLRNKPLLHPGYARD